MEESIVQQQIQVDAVTYKCQLMRNNSGAFRTPEGRWMRFGLGNVSKKHGDKIKSSDLVGFRQVVVTPEMVGKTIAVFVAVEVKQPGWAPSMLNAKEAAQNAFIQWIKKAGGIAGFCSSVEDFRKIIGVL